MYARLFGMPGVNAAVEDSLRRFDLWDRRGDRAAQLSKGMKQKLSLARALVHDPEVVLLDEPTANLDPQTSRSVRELLAELRGRGRAVVVSTHNLDEIERVADRVALISRRLVAIGEPAVLRRQIFGRRLMVHLGEGGPAVPDLMVIAGRAGAGRPSRRSRDLDGPGQSGRGGTGRRSGAGRGGSINPRRLRRSAAARGRLPAADVVGFGRLLIVAAVMISGHRIRTLVAKELREFRSNPAAVLPVVGTRRHLRGAAVLRPDCHSAGHGRIAGRRPHDQRDRGARRPDAAAPCAPASGDCG